ncbi:hypothetical protein KIN20_024929 [Parelaphostrongylus tenuis]|uniref:Uncharacterized protein n=1 Tax=Parelaphostrongylus tenuis TaxID=148309 RepID=A0AAD5MUA2_PARTN|nr:hypothetical protein KIN20_024929 [Parelaphostrongylus tenuis]
MRSVRLGSAVHPSIFGENPTRSRESQSTETSEIRAKDQQIRIESTSGCIRDDKNAKSLHYTVIPVYKRLISARLMMFSAIFRPTLFYDHYNHGFYW